MMAFAISPPHAMRQRRVRHVMSSALMPSSALPPRVVLAVRVAYYNADYASLRDTAIQPFACAVMSLWRRVAPDERFMPA